jgi:hypothetical protein
MVVTICYLSSAVLTFGYWPVFGAWEARGEDEAEGVIDASWVGSVDREEWLRGCAVEF